jgi:lysozyme family protein
MTAPERSEGRLTTLEAVLTAERILAAFDNQDGTFGKSFLAADRDVLGAMVAYASLGVREIAARDDATLAEVRQQFRRRVSQLQAKNELDGDL